MSENEVKKDLCDQRYGELKEGQRIIHARIDKHEAERRDTNEKMEQELKLVHSEILNAKEEIRSGMIKVLSRAVYALGGAFVAVLLILIVAIATGMVKII